MPKLTPIPQDLAAGPFALSTALDADLSASRLRGKDLQRPMRGVRASAGGPPVHPVVAYATKMPVHQFFSHITAAQFHGLPVPERLLRVTVPHVAVVTPARPPRAAGIVGHRLETANVVTIRGYRVLDPVATWCALASALTVDELIAMGDALMRRNNPLATMAELNDAVLSRTGCRGIRKLTEALRQVRSGTDSVKETELRLLLARAGLPEPVINFRIVNEFGAFVAFGDLVYVEWKVVTEYDGRQHAENKAQFAKDITRLDDIMALDYRVVRINETLLSLKLPAITRVRNALIQAGWRG